MHQAQALRRDLMMVVTAVVMAVTTVGCGVVRGDDPPRGCIIGMHVELKDFQRGHTVSRPTYNHIAEGTEGFTTFRESCDRYLRDHGVYCEPTLIVVFPGAEQAREVITNLDCFAKLRVGFKWPARAAECA